MPRILTVPARAALLAVCCWHGSGGLRAQAPPDTPPPAVTAPALGAPEPLPPERNIFMEGTEHT